MYERPKDMYQSGLCSIAPQIAPSILGDASHAFTLSTVDLVNITYSVT